jgi:hypothetical protein
MAKNKQQLAAEARAKATQPAAEQPKAEEVKATPAAAPATISKQQLTIVALAEAFKAQRGIEVKPEMLKQDGKYVNLLIGKEWPTIRIGNSGGITVMELKSYAKAFDAAIQGDTLLAKQTAREQKKVAATAPAAAKQVA